MAKRDETAARRAARKLARRGRGSAADRLARLVVDDLLATPLDEIVDVDEVVERGLDALRAVGASDALEALVGERIAAWEATNAADDGAIRDWLTGDAEVHLDALLAAPYALEPEQTLRALDHEAMRGLVRKVLRETLTTFARRMRPSVPDSRVLKGIGRRARKLAQRPRERLGGLGDGVVGMVGGEVERQMERRVGEFVDGAVSGVLRRIAEYLGDAAHADQFGRMRVAAARIALDADTAALGRALGELDRGELVATVAAFLRGLPDAPALERYLRDAIASELASAGTLGEYLDRGGLREPWGAWARAVVADRARALARTEGFEAWLEALLAT